VKRLGLIFASTVVMIGLATAPAGAAGTSNTKQQHPVKHHKANAKKKAAETTAQYAAQYTAIVAPLNAAESTFNTADDALHAEGNTTTAAKVTPIITPLVAAFQTCDQKLAAVKWPGQTETDIRKVISDTGAITGDFMAYESATALTASSVLTKLAQDEGVVTTDVDLVHSDLGLPQGASS
jgi:hypothetical protein